MSKPKIRDLAWLGVLISVYVVCFAIVQGVETVRADRPPSPRVCFPIAQWNTGTVPARFRPCARVTWVAEDGSVGVAVSDASGVVRDTYSVGALDR